MTSRGSFLFIWEKFIEDGDLRSDKVGRTEELQGNIVKS